MIILWWYFWKNLWKANTTWHWLQKYASLLKRTIHWSLNSIQPRTVQKDSFPLYNGSFGYIWNILYQWSQCIVRYQNTSHILSIMVHLDTIEHLISMIPMHHKYQNTSYFLRTMDHMDILEHLKHLISMIPMHRKIPKYITYPLYHGSFGYIWNIWYQWSQCIVKYQNTLYFLCIMDHLDKSKNTKINHIFSLLWIIRIHLNICNIWSHYIGNGPYKACITFMKRYHSWCAI